VSPKVHVAVASPLASVVLDAGDTDPPSDTIQDTATPAEGCPESVTWTTAGIGVATTAVRSVKPESTLMLRPLDDVDVPEVDGDELVTSREHAVTAQTAARRTGWDRIPV